MPEEPQVALELLGWPPDGPTLRLHHERFSYAGKFVMSSTGKAVARTRAGDDESEDADAGIELADLDSSERADLPYATDVLAAVAFNEDRTDASSLWLRYVTVDRAYRGRGLGPKLVAFVRDAALERGYDHLRIAVNNPYAYDALWKADFGFTGETTGIAELVLEHPTRATTETYRRGLERFLERDLSEGERAFLEHRLEEGPPSRIDSP
ncbi:GNAT family N-acetyltransferase [Natronosalvus rutilus]|uniref:GNAT family N-acetyltransferase n=1 Tax=Natronosalvus rutilus TaxID=2953753 RepID=A0A9E7NAZ5_9EURY|nr:GNAT family N-acetyltransferase [Natronosalvus rutilus]UTF53570.1 GNAT family N-acetyltransferase [Natronosalvus rutilus]